MRRLRIGEWNRSRLGESCDYETWWKPLAGHKFRIALAVSGRPCHGLARGFCHVLIGPFNRPRTCRTGQSCGSPVRVGWQSTSITLTGESAEEPP